MKKTDRIKIMKEVNKRIKKDIKDFTELESGEKEVVQDKYIALVCQENGFSLSEFYHTNGVELDNLLWM